MSHAKKDRTKHKPADPHAYLKVPKINLKIGRECLCCKSGFIAETRYIRLCEQCRKKDHE